MKLVLNFRNRLPILLSFLLLFATGCYDSDNNDEPQSDNNSMVSLAVSEGELSPSFSDAQTQYSVEVGNSVGSIQVTATTQSDLASLTINGVAIESGTASDSIILEVGNNSVLVVVTSESGSSRTTTLIINREDLPSNNANLSSLIISDGSLAPVFEVDTLIYNVSVGNSVATVTVTPTSEDDNATMTVNEEATASGSESTAVNLAVGDTVITILVTAEDGTNERAYTITVTRDAPLSDNVDLSNLSLSVGSLTPTFTPSVLSYNSTVSFGNQFITVTPTLSDSNASVTVNSESVASGSASQSISLLEGDNSISIIVLAEDGIETQTYTININRQAAASFAQQAYIKASNTGFEDRFGWVVALDGDTLAVAAPRERSASTGVNGNEDDNSAARSGAVYVFTRTNNTWSQQAYIKASNTELYDNFGWSLALDGDTLAIGANAEDSSSTGINGDQDNSGASGSGAVYVFTRTNSTWSQQAYIKASNTDNSDGFGYSVALLGNRLAVGAPAEDGSSMGINGDDTSNGTANSGAVYLFTRTNNIWSQQDYVKASNTGVEDWFGHAVDLDGDSLAVGAFSEDSSSTGINGDGTNNNAINSGAVYLFTLTGSTWSQQAYIKASNAETLDNFGGSVALSGDSLAVGAYYEDGSSTGINGDESNNSAEDSGAVYLFTRSSGTWSQQAYIKASNTETNDVFGVSVALDGDRLAVGATLEDSSSTGIDGDESNNQGFGSGAVYLFTRAGTTWSQQTYIKASNTGFNDQFGRVAIDGTTIVISAIDESSSSVGVDGDQGNNDTSKSGAVFAYE